MENLTMGNDNISLQEITYLSEKTGLTNFIASEEKGYDAILDPTGKRISKHIKQKIKLIRALAGKPTLLLLEEPLNDLTQKEKEDVSAYLKNESNATVIAISNDNLMHANCDELYLLNEGNLSK